MLQVYDIKYSTITGNRIVPHGPVVNELPGHVHVHSIQINVQKPDRVSATEGQLPAGGLLPAPAPP